MITVVTIQRPDGHYVGVVNGVIDSAERDRLADIFGCRLASSESPGNDYVWDLMFFRETHAVDKLVGVTHVDGN